MKFKQGRYSAYLRPFLILFDIGTINLLALYFFNFNVSQLHFFSSPILNNKHLLFLIYTVFTWSFSTFFIKFYKVYRFTSLLNILTLLIKQFIAFLLIIFSFIGIFRSININSIEIFKFSFICFGLIGLMKILSYYLLKKYRIYLNGNVRRIIIVGTSKGAQRLKELVSSKKDLGYNLVEIFSDYDTNVRSLEDSFQCIEEENIDEIYCAMEELTEAQINEFVKVASLNNCNIKFIPESKMLFTKRMETEYYNYLPILSIQEIALNQDINFFVKRLFDIIFSLFVIIFILSWIIPVLFLIIKINSRGPLFYKHLRNGINYEVFTCYKFRTLKTNTGAQNEYVKRDDDRVTSVGRFLRKYSIDELPQFYNVLFGDMSVVGPRPHMEYYTDKYSQVIDKYSFIYRHSVKPGLTGLAQVKGYRGEIKSKEDIINRVKYDIFYIENWSILLDIKIIVLTIINIIKGEEKAY